MRAMPLGVREGDRERLIAWTRASTIRPGLARRARIVLLAAQGVSHSEIAERVGASRQNRQPPRPCALHPDLGVLAEPGRGLVRHHRTPSHPTRRVSQRP
jgi:Homeodomain-like domain